MSRHRKIGVMAAGGLMLALLTAGVGRSSVGISRSFWLAIPANLDSDGNSLSIVSGTPGTSYEVESADSTLSESGTVGPNSPDTVALPDALNVEGSETIESKGIHVTSNGPIGVTFFSDNASGFSSGGTLVTPQNALGQTYRAVGYQGSLAPSLFTIVGTTTDTSMEVTPKCESTEGSNAGTPINLTLDAGDTWQYECEDNGDVTGSKIVADAKVAVFGSNRCAVLPPGTFCDYLVEQMIPVSKWAKKYLLAPIGDSEDDIVRVVTNQNNTTITASDVTGLPASIPSAGSFGEGSMSGAGRISADKPIFVAQYAPTPECCDDAGDPLMIGVQPTSAATKDHRFVSPAGYTTSLVNVVMPNGTDVEIDGDPISASSPVPGGTHSYATIDVDEGPHFLHADAKVNAYAYGLRSGSAYGLVVGPNPKRIATKTTLSVDKSKDQVRAYGRVKPGGRGKMDVELYRKKSGNWKLLKTNHPLLSRTSKYSTKFPRPHPGKCKIHSEFPGDADYLPSSASRQFSC